MVFKVSDTLLFSNSFQFCHSTFFLATSHLLLFSTKSQTAKNVTQLFFAISISTIWNNRFSDFSCSLFSYQKGKKVWKFFFWKQKHWFNFSRNWCSDLNGTGNTYTKTISFISITKWSLFYLIFSGGLLCLMEN